MTEISRERRDKIRERLRITGSLRQIRDSEIPMEITVGELRALLDYADERDEAVPLLQQAETALRNYERDSLADRIDALLRRMVEPE